MPNNMTVCRECGETFFNRKKLDLHLIIKHGYIVELPNETEEEENAKGD